MLAQFLLVLYFLILSAKLGVGSIISWESYDDFRNGGWNGTYFEAKAASELPPEFTGNVRDLPGRDLWYYHANGTATETAIVWEAPDIIIKSPTILVRLEYYTSATVTILPVRDVSLESLEPTSGIAWGQHSTDIDLEISSPQMKNQIVLNIMTASDGYLLFNQITLEYEDTTTTLSDSTTVATSISTETPSTSTGLVTISSTTTAETSTMSTDSSTLVTEPSAATTEASTLAATTEPVTVTTGPSTIVTDFSTMTTTLSISSSDPSTFTTEPETQPSTMSSTSFSSSSSEASTMSTVPWTPSPIPTLPGDRCYPDYLNCSNVPYTECVYQSHDIYTCQCIEGTDLSLNCERCIRRAETIESPCESYRQCLNLPNTECQANEFGYKYCICVDDFVASISKKYCLPKVHQLGLPCREDVQCVEGISTANVRCTAGICQCADQYIPNTDRTRCLKVLGFGETCEDDSQCVAGIGHYGICEANICSCVPGTGYFSTKCYRSIPIGDNCLTDEECILGSNLNKKAVCDELEFVCHCSQDGTMIEWDGACYQRLLVGDVCRTDLECSVPIAGPVACDDETYRCTCTYGKTAVEDGQTCSGHVIATLHFFTLLMMSCALIFKTL